MKHLLTALLAVVFFAVNAEAAPSYRSTLSSAKNLRKSELKLAKAVAGLSSPDREKLKRALGSVGGDSDGDGVSDLYERARHSNVCNPDSDGDGIDDSDDGYERDDDKQGEVEVRGAVTSFEDPSLVVGGKTFTVTDTTRFRRGVSSKADLVAGTCIKVEGYVDASNVNIATKIEGSSGCSGGSGDDDSNDD
ncbi:MAG: hypothetical protein RIS36_1801 [Pseudomonadota bacterium]|jgi:hypothetical protein